MIITNSQSKVNTIKNSFRSYSLALIRQELLLEAIKKDEINTIEYSTLNTSNETDLQKAEKILALAKNRRSNIEALAVLQKNMESTALEITNYIVTHKRNNLIYTLKRNGFESRRYQFQVSHKGQLQVFLVS